MNSVTNCSRVFKESRSLVQGNIVESILIVGMWEPGLPVHQEYADKIFIWRIPLLSSRLPKCKLRIPLQSLERRARLILGLLGRRIVAVQAHSVPTLLDACLLKALWGAKLIYDCHELETEVPRTRLVAKWERAVESRFIHRADELIVVGNRIADWYQARYNVPRPTVIRNVPERRQIPLEATNTLRSELGLSQSDIVFLYQGLLSPGRSIERMLRVFELLDQRHHLVCLGYGPLQAAVEEAASRSRNIHFLPAVPPARVLEYTCGADVGLVLIENICLSYYYSLPNKLFECVLAGTPVVVYGYPEVSDFVQKYGCGWIIEPDDASFSNFVQTVTDGEIKARRRSLKSADLELSWESEVLPLLKMYEVLD